MPYQCPCCKGWYPFPKNNGWIDSVCKECETSLFNDPKYPHLGISGDFESLTIHVPNHSFPMQMKLPRGQLTDSPEPCQKDGRITAVRLVGASFTR